uniref:(California timema) hypothetical protein n=1 Tax=Timema californicum TaxID=61474 RepID=A0A7R9J8W3_TIMCA|nr:unnamed protein product [Timema californicum]
MGPCFGNHPNTARPAKAHPTNSWHNNKHLSSPEPTKPWKPITGYKDGRRVGGGRNEKVKLKKLHQHCLENNPVSKTSSVTVNEDPQNVFPFLDGPVCCLLLVVICSATVLQDGELNCGPAHEEAREQDHVTGPLAPHMAGPEVKSAREKSSSGQSFDLASLLTTHLNNTSRKTQVEPLRVMHPTQMLLGMIAVFVAFALFCYFTNAKRSASRFRNNHPYFSTLVVLAGIYFIVYMLGSVIVFIFGILLPVVAKHYKGQEIQPTYPTATTPPAAGFTTRWPARLDNPHEPDNRPNCTERHAHSKSQEQQPSPTPGHRLERTSPVPKFCFLGRLEGCRVSTANAVVTSSFCMSLFSSLRSREVRFSNVSITSAYESHALMNALEATWQTLECFCNFVHVGNRFSNVR